MLLRALFRSGGPKSIDAQHRRERATPPAPAAQSPASAKTRRRRFCANATLPASSRRGEFQGMLINLLKERYIAGKIDQNQYEAAA